MSVDTICQDARTWVETGLTAIGSTQANAFPLNNNTQNEFTTVGSGTGCILPMAFPSPPSQISVFNAGSNALAVYPPLGGTINGGTVNAPYSLAAGTGLTYWASSLSNWYSVQTSNSGGGSGTVNSGTVSNLAYYGATGTAVSGGTKFGYDATNTCPIWTPVPAPGSPSQGDQWFDSVAGAIVTCRFVDGSGNALNTMDDGTFFRCGSCTALANTASQTSILGSPTNSWGSKTIPSGALRAGQIIEIAFQALLQSTNTPTLTWFVTFGGTTVLFSAANTVSANPNTTNVQIAPWALYIRSTGSSGSINGAGYTATLDAGLQSWFFGTRGQGNGTGADITGVNYNQANAVDLQAQYSAASTSNTVQVIGCQMRLRG